MNLKYILIAFMAVNFLSNAEKIHDIYNFITDLQDASVVMETSLRTQFNTFFGERVKSVATLTTILKNIQNQMPELDKYKSIEVGLGIVDAFERNTNVVRKNVLFSVKAEMDQGKTTYSNILYDYLMDNYGFVDHVARSSKNLFNEGKGCVIAMKTEMLSFIDLTGKKYMECIKNVSISHPIQPSKFLTYQTNLTTTYNTISYKLKEPFWYIWLYSTKAQNDTAAEKLNKYCQELFPTILDVSKQVAQAGLDIIGSLKSNVNAFKTCFNRMNSTLIDVKRHEFLNRINDVCSRG